MCLAQRCLAQFSSFQLLLSYLFFLSDWTELTPQVCSLCWETRAGSLWADSLTKSIYKCACLQTISVSKSPRGQLKLFFFSLWISLHKNRVLGLYVAIDLIKGTVTLVTISATMQCGPNAKSTWGNFIGTGEILQSTNSLWIPNFANVTAP